MAAQPPNTPNQMSLLGQGPQHPGQIDISLSLLGTDSKDALKAFTDQVGNLSGSLKSIVAQQKDILDALGQVAPSVGSNAGGAFEAASSAAGWGNIMDQQKQIIADLGKVVASASANAAGRSTPVSSAPEIWVPPNAKVDQSSNAGSMPWPRAPSPNSGAASRPGTGLWEEPELNSSPAWGGYDNAPVDQSGVPTGKPPAPRPAPTGRSRGTGRGTGSGSGGTRVGSRGPRGDAALAGTGADDPGFYIPRIGEFNSQDILRQLQHATGRASQLAGRVGQTGPGSALTSAIGGAARTGFTQAAIGASGIPGVGSALSNIISRTGQGLLGGGGQSGIGGVSGTLGYMSQRLGDLAKLAPYAGAFTQTTGIPLNPYTAVSQGTSMGLAQGGTTLGIGGFGVRIPGISVGTNGISLSPAGQQAMTNAGQALSYGLSPGGSASWMRQAQNSMESLGWSGSTLKNANNAWGALQSSGQYGGGAIGSTSTVAPLIDGMIRYGSSSLKDFVAVLKSLPDAAQAANMSVDASNQSLLQFAETAKGQGSNFTQALINGAAIQMGTGMSAASQQQAMGNPLVSGVLAAKNNILPGMTNLLGAGQQIGAVASRATQLSDEITQQRIAAGNNPKLAREQGDQFAAQMLGLTAQQVKVYRTVGAKKMTAMTSLSGDAIKADKSMNEIQHSNLLKAALQKEGKPGKVGIHGGAYLNGKWTTNESLQTSAKDAALQPLYAEAKKAGLKGSEWTKVFGPDKNPTRPMDVTTRLDNWVKNQTKGNTRDSGKDGTIDLSPAAQRWFTLKTGLNWKDMSNAGYESTNTPAATLPNPSAVFGGSPTRQGVH